MNKKMETLVLLLGLAALPAAAQERPAQGDRKPGLAKAAAGRTVELAVTEDGFEPGLVKVKKGEPVTLMVTRKTDATCAKELVIDGADVKGGKELRQALPLNAPVRFTFTPVKEGELRYGCGMGKMMGGVLTVE